MSHRRLPPRREEPAGVRRRRPHHVACEVLVEYRVRGRDTTGQAAMVGIGLGGARIDFPEEIGLPAEVDLSIPAAGGGSIDLAARVIWTVAGGEGRPSPTGLRFEHLDHATKQELYDLLGSLEHS